MRGRSHGLATADFPCSLYEIYPLVGMSGNTIEQHAQGTAVIKIHIQFFFFSSRRRHTRFKCDWSSDVCSSDLVVSRVGNAVATRKKLKSSMRVEERRPRCYRGSSSRYMSWHVTQEPVMAASRLMKIGRASCRERG